MDIQDYDILDNFTNSSSETNATLEYPIQWVPLDTFVGLILAFSSCAFIGISVIFKKLALNDLEIRGRTRAVDGGYGYLKVPRWWVGIILMGLGELTNFFAYIFAPAILVTPLGVFSIVCTAILSPYFLKEKLNALGKLGCILVIVGCIMVTLCGPKDREISTMDDLQGQLLHPGFLIYAAIVTIFSLILMTLVPRYGHKYVMLYISICSSFGSLSVMFAKGIGLAVKETYCCQNEFNNWATWVCICSLLICLLIETIYMQRALDLFNSSVFMSVNYVMFTSLVIIASSILYTELRDIGWKNIVLTILGFVVNIAALYLLHLDKSPTPAIEDTRNNNIPDQGPVSPLLQKDEKMLKNESLSKMARNSSPLASVTLTPALLKSGGGKFISFINKDTHEVISELNRDKACDSVSSSAEDRPSCSSLSNSSSILCLPEDPPQKCEGKCLPGGSSCFCQSESKWLKSEEKREPVLQTRPISESVSDADEATQLV